VDVVSTIINCKEDVVMGLIKEFVGQEDGIGVVEIILILVVLISLVILFKSKITELVNTIFNKITKNANKV